jgi:hypothetical protein
MAVRITVHRMLGTVTEPLPNKDATVPQRYFGSWNAHVT